MLGRARWARRTSTEETESIMTTSRTVLVTGGNRGIGFAIAREFIAQGHRVAVTARSGEGPEGSLTVRADVTDAASVDQAFTEVEAALGRVEVVVANAGITRDTLLMRMSEDEFTSVIDTNLTGAFRVVKRASKGMLKARFGRIVLISSVVGLFGGAGQVNYSSSKAARQPRPEQGMDHCRLPGPDDIQQGAGGSRPGTVRTQRRGIRLAADRSLQGLACHQR